MGGKNRNLCIVVIFSTRLSMTSPVPVPVPVPVPQPQPTTPLSTLFGRPDKPKDDSKIIKGKINVSGLLAFR